MSQPSKAWPMADTKSPEAFPVRACQRASLESAKALAPMIPSPIRRNGTIKLICNGVARKLASIIVGPLHLVPRIATAMPQKTTVTPQIGNTPRVMPRAADNASCFGSTPLCNHHQHTQMLDASKRRTLPISTNRSFKMVAEMVPPKNYNDRFVNPGPSPSHNAVTPPPPSLPLHRGRMATLNPPSSDLPATLPRPPPANPPTTRTPS